MPGLSLGMSHMVLAKLLGSLLSSSEMERTSENLAFWIVERRLFVASDLEVVGSGDTEGLWKVLSSNLSGGIVGGVSQEHTQRSQH